VVECVKRRKFFETQCICCVLLAMVMKTDDVMATVAMPTDIDNQPILDQDASKPGLCDGSCCSTIQ